jgi:hypothetical protein
MAAAAATRRRRPPPPALQLLHWCAVFEDTLIASAKKFGLIPFRAQIPANLVDLFETPTNTRCVLKHFEPRYTSTTHPDLANVSRLFAAFAFMKR